MKTNKLVTLLSLIVAGTSSVWAADPLPAQKFPGGIPKPVQPGVGPAPALNLKPDLALSNIQSWGLSGEFCKGGCPELRQDFNLTLLSCGFYADIKNAGSGPSTPTTAVIRYTFSPWPAMLRGPHVTVKLVGNIPALRPGEIARVNFPLPSDRKQRYANVHVGVELIIDPDNRVAEISENNNRFAHSSL